MYPEAPLDLPGIHYSGSAGNRMHFFFPPTGLWQEPEQHPGKPQGSFFFFFSLLGVVLKAVTLGKVDSNKGQAGGLTTRKFSVALL